MIQFALILPFVLLLVVALIDLSRIGAITAILNKGADDGLNLASKIANLDIDIRNLEPTDPAYLDYWEARARVLTEATRFPLATLLSDHNQQSAAQLLPFTTTDVVVAGGSTPEIERGVAMLRPGERASLDDNGTVSNFDHPTVPPDGAGMPPATAPKILMLAEPIVVELRARVKLWTPFFDSWVVSGTAIGFREQVPLSPFGVKEEPLPAGVSGPIPSPTPSPEPSQVPPPSPTPEPTFACVIDFSACVVGAGTSPCNAAGCCPNPAGTGPGACPCDIGCNLKQ